MNEQTAVNNYYQHHSEAVLSQESVWLKEFDSFVDALRAREIEVVLYEDLESLDTPDSIFPNNWISFHGNTLVTYPMFAPNRRLERRNDIIEDLKLRFDITKRLSFEDWEQKGHYLEGTGSLVLDRVNKIAYAARSERTSLEVLEAWSKATGYKLIVFGAFQRTVDGRKPVYHTNVVMSIGSEWSVVCGSAIDDPVERAKVMESLSQFRKVIDISEDAMDGFGGNILEVENLKEKKWLIMSSTAAKALNSYLPQLITYAEPLIVSIEAIETAGGGSARCMLAEVFLFSHEF
jgi:hypothetical protein